MKHSPPPHGDNRPSVMTVQRLQQVFDAYGANLERWPSEERAAALVLLAQSVEARAQQEEAARLDSLLNLAPVAYPSAELVTRLLAAAPIEETQAENPRNRSVRLLRSGRRHQSSATQRTGNRDGPHRMRVWLSLAVAASLAVALWGVRTLTPLHQELPPDVIANLGVYDTPTDVLLQPPGFDILNTLPSVGCMDSELGCLKLNVSSGVESRSPAIERKYV